MMSPGVGLLLERMFRFVGIFEPRVECVTLALHAGRHEVVRVDVPRSAAWWAVDYERDRVTNRRTIKFPPMPEACRITHARVYIGTVELYRIRFDRGSFRVQRRTRPRFSAGALRFSA